MSLKMFPDGFQFVFYKDMVTGPEGKGDFVPGGLLGEALCFDLEERDEALIWYIQTHLNEAYQYAKGLEGNS